MKEFYEYVVRDSRFACESDVRDELLEFLGKSTWFEDLKRYFGAHRDVASVFRSCCRERALDYVKEEISRLASKKESVGLTDEDREFAATGLQGILDSVETMCIEGIANSKR